MNENASKAITIIEPKKGWIPIDFKEIWRYRELFYFLVDGRDKLSQKWSFKTEPPGKGTELSGMYVNFNLELNRSMV